MAQDRPLIDKPQAGEKPKTENMRFQPSVRRCNWLYYRRKLPCGKKGNKGGRSPQCFGLLNHL